MKIFLFVIQGADSLSMYKLDSLQKSINLLMENNKSGSWYASFMPLFAAIMGGALVILGQYLERRSRLTESNTKQKRDDDLRLVDMCSIARTKMLEISYYYKYLAMFKVNSKYWFYCSEVESQKNDPQGLKDAETYFAEHLNAVKDIWSTEQKLIELTSAFISCATTFHMLKKSAIDGNEVELIYNFKFEKAREYPLSTDYNELYNNILARDIETLTAQHLKIMKHFENILSVMCK